MSQLQSLLDGYQAFYKQYFEQDTALYEALSQGQSPLAMMIACSDSRVDPAVVTQAKPGELFMVRNVANLVPAYAPDQQTLEGVGAALEYAVCVLKVPHLIVSGHSACGGIQALMQPESVASTDYISSWVSSAASVREQMSSGDSTSPEHLNECGRASVITSLKNLMTYPWVAERVNDGALSLHGWYFSIHNGILEQYTEDRWQVV